MKVLVTGATTPLGLAILEGLLATAEVELVLAIGREPRSPRPADARVIYEQLDLERPRVVHDLLWGPCRSLGIDAVVHGMQHRQARDRGRHVHAQNVDAIRELVIGCRTHPTIRRFVYRSFAEVYALRHATSDLLDEDEPLDFAADSQWVRDRVEADLTVCSQLGGTLSIAVLRFAEILAPEMGSQLWDYLQSRVCLRPLGFDPMLNVLSLADAMESILRALRSPATGVFNIAGLDTLPLSQAIFEAQRADIPVPGPLLASLYGLRRQLAGFDFHYEMNLRRFHFGGVLDGTRARDLLGYLPSTPVQWPSPWWHTLLARLGQRGTTIESNSLPMPSIACITSSSSNTSR
jgi:UDP-glucose 4-epimerase